MMTFGNKDYRIQITQLRTRRSIFSRSTSRSWRSSLCCSFLTFLLACCCYSTHFDIRIMNSLFVHNSGPSWDNSIPPELLLWGNCAEISHTFRDAWRDPSPLPVCLWLKDSLEEDILSPPPAIGSGQTIITGKRSRALSRFGWSAWLL